MNNKVLIKLFFPKLEKTFDLYIPVNQVIWKINSLLVKAISSLCDIDLPGSNYVLINKETGQIYGNNEIVINTNIRNATELMLVQLK